MAATRAVIRKVSLTVVFLFHLAAAAAGQSYQLAVVARSGQAGLLSIQDGVSINDSGRVAFTGDLQDGAGVFVASGNGALVNISSELTRTPNRRVDRYVQINNSDLVVAVDRTATSPILSFVRLWDFNYPERVTTIARGNSSCGFTEECTGLYRYNTILPGPSLANAAPSAPTNTDTYVAFSAVSGDSHTMLATEFNELVAPGSGTLLRPMVADDGRVVVKLGSEPASPIYILNSDLSVSETIADAAHWLRLGRAPGMSDQGTAVAFYGELSQAGGDALGLPAGEGIFVSVLVGQQRILQRVATTVIADPKSTISSFDRDARVAVNEIRGVLFSGFDSDGNKGLYTSQLSFFVDARSGQKTIPLDGSPTRLARQGDVIDGFGPITGLGIYDPLNNNGDVAFWVGSASGQGVIRGTRSCRGDYPDPPNSTYTYINQYDAGERLRLPKQGQNACGPSSLAMLLNALHRLDGTEPEVLENLYEDTTSRSSATDLQARDFNYRQAVDALQTLTSFRQARMVEHGTPTCVDREDHLQCVSLLDEQLDAGIPVVGSTYLSRAEHFNHGLGHVVLFLARTAMGDYVVDDPAGNYFSAAQGHYGPSHCGVGSHQLGTLPARVSHHLSPL